jgi:hypothetical protein
MRDGKLTKEEEEKKIKPCQKTRPNKQDDESCKQALYRNKEVKKKVH